MSAAIQRAGDSLAVSGDMTMETAAALLAAGNAGIAAGEPRFDLSGVVNIDSSCLAVLFGWQRTAQTQGKALAIASLPASLVSLAEVYGVTELLPLS
jgi:phospholipid transport system transporter-binding protein